MNESICPVCGANDAVQHVSTIVDSGTQTTMGGGLIFAGMGQGGIAPMLTASRTTNNLAKRLSPHTLTPGNVSWGGVLGIYGLLALVFAFIIREMVFGSIPDESFLMVIFTGVLFIIPGILLSLVTSAVLIIIYRYSRPIARRRWIKKATLLYNARYCFRDDVVFDDYQFAAPETYLNYLFANNRPLTLNVNNN